jgi:uncharacterized membrane protein
MQRLMLAVPALLLATFVYFACTREPVKATQPDPEIIITPEGDTIYVVNTDTIYINNPPPITTHPCSPDTVYFEQDLLPIITSNCALPTCHDNISHEEGVWLTSYEKILTTGGVKLSTPTSSKLYTSTSPYAGERMPPPPAAALTSQQRALLLKWIQQGAQDLHCDAPCDTTAFTYSASIQPILALHCNGCHSGSTASGGINYSAYAGIKATVDNGKLWASISHASGVKPMPYPQGSQKLDDCDMIRIRKWIEAGAPNN